MTLLFFNYTPLYEPKQCTQHRGVSKIYMSTKAWFWQVFGKGFETLCLTFEGRRFTNENSSHRRY